MSNQAIHAEKAANERGAASREPFTRAVELIVDNEPDLRAELRSLVQEHMSQQGRLSAQGAIEELLRERCESHAGLDVNENDMLTPFARELLLHAFSSVDWESLAEALAGKAIGGHEGQAGRR